MSDGRAIAVRPNWPEEEADGAGPCAVERPRRSGAKRLQEWRKKRDEGWVCIKNLWLPPLVLERLILLGELPDCAADDGAGYAEPLVDYLDRKAAADHREVKRCFTVPGPKLRNVETDLLDQAMTGITTAPIVMNEPMRD